MIPMTSDPQAQRQLEQAFAAARKQVLAESKQLRQRLDDSLRQSIAERVAQLRKSRHE